MRMKAILFAIFAVAWPAASQTVFNINPTRSFGQARLSPITTANPNLVEGRELYSPLGLALDTSASTPIVYVADTFNDRVLAWKNSAGFNNGDMADLVIGQKDLFSTLRGGPGTSLSSGLISRLPSLSMRRATCMSMTRETIALSVTPLLLRRRPLPYSRTW